MPSNLAEAGQQPIRRFYLGGQDGVDELYNPHQHTGLWSEAATGVSVPNRHFRMYIMRLLGSDRLPMNPYAFDGQSDGRIFRCLSNDPI